MADLRIRVAETSSNLAVLEILTRGSPPTADELGHVLGRARLRVVFSEAWLTDKSLCQYWYVSDEYQRPLTRRRISEAIGDLLTALEARLWADIPPCGRQSSGRRIRQRAPLRADYLT